MVDREAYIAAQFVVTTAFLYIMWYHINTTHICIRLFQIQKALKCEYVAVSSNSLFNVEWMKYVCNSHEIEDEFHFIISSNAYIEIRQVMYNCIASQIEEFIHLKLLFIS